MVNTKNENLSYKDNIIMKAIPYLERGSYSLAIRDLVYLRPKEGEKDLGKEILEKYLGRTQKQSYDIIEANIYLGRIDEARNIARDLLKNSKNKSRLVEKLSYHWERLFQEKPRHGTFSDKGMAEYQMFVQNEYSANYNPDYRRNHLEYNSCLSMYKSILSNSEIEKGLASKIHNHLAEKMASEGHFLHAATAYGAIGSEEKAKRLELQYLNEITHDCLSEIKENKWKEFEEIPFSIRNSLGFVIQAYKLLDNKGMLKRLKREGFDHKNTYFRYDLTCKFREIPSGCYSEGEYVMQRSSGPGYFESKYGEKHNGNNTRKKI